MSINDAYEEDQKYALDEYENAFIEAVAEVTENGEVLGLRKVSKRKLRSFFDSVSPMDWFAQTQVDPQGALAMLSEYMAVGGAA